MLVCVLLCESLIYLIFESDDFHCFSIHMQTILKISGFTDNILTHLLAGLGAGFFAVCIGSPVDVVSVLYPFLILFLIS